MNVYKVVNKFGKWVRVSTDCTDCEARIRAEVIDEVRKLITSRLKRECNFNYCDDNDECCEVNVLMWLDKQIEQLKEQK